MAQLAEHQVITWGKTFQEAFCEKFRCPPNKFEEKVFWKCMHLHAFVPALYFYKKNPGIFKEDFDFIREIATVRDSDIFKSELNRFHGRNLRDKSWLRGTFAVRLSGKRLIRLKNEVIKGLD